MQNTKKMPVQILVLGAILTALVVIMQLLGAFIRLGPFSISLVLIPIVIGAAKCGPKVSTWLGLVFGVVVLLTDAAAFLAISVPGTVVTVLAKGMACGLAAGLICKYLGKNHPYWSTILAAVACPVVNTGVFLLGCRLFFFETVKGWGVVAGFENVGQYMILGLVGANFLFEMASNVILSPIIVRILNVGKKN